MRWAAVSAGLRKLGGVRLWLALTGLALAVMLLHTGLRGLSLHAWQARLAQVPGWLWGMAVLGVLASHGLRAARLRAEWHGRTRARFLECLQLMLLHNAAVILLPLRSGETGYAWWLQRRWGVPLCESLPSLLWLRLQDLLVLAWLACVLMLPPVWAGIACVGLLVLGWTVLPALGRCAQAVIRLHLATPAAPAPASAGALPKAARFVGRLGRAVALAALAGRGGRSAWVYAVANWCLRLTVVAALLAALAPLAPLEAARGALGGEWAAVLPVQGPAGLGTYEAGVWLGALGGEGPRGPRFDAVIGAALVVHLLWLAVSLGAALPAAFWPGPAGTPPQPGRTRWLPAAARPTR